MACPICDHTMQSMCLDVFWCPRCGTVRDAGRDSSAIPMLVQRVVDFGSLLNDESDDVAELIVEFERLGIRESICLEG